MPAWAARRGSSRSATDVGPLPPRGGWDNWILGWTRGRQDPRPDEPGPLELPNGALLPRRSEGRPRDAARDSRGGLGLLLARRDQARLLPRRSRVPDLEANERAGGRRTSGSTTSRRRQSERLTDLAKGPTTSRCGGATPIYFTSDREQTLNLCAVRPRRREQTRKLTSFTRIRRPLAEPRRRERSSS